MREFFSPVLDAFSALLGLIHDGLDPIFGAASWGWSIIALTLVVRILLLPLAIKQTRSMKAMQALQPQLKALQQKYKVDRDLMRKDPETYRQRRQKMNEEMMALYQRENANPAASCLPLLAQAPIFLALFWTLTYEEALEGAPFYFITGATAGGLEKLVSAAGWPGWLLILIMSGTMFWSQKQMMARTAATMGDNPMAQQQKVLLYVMPIFLGAISFNFPLGILLYWVTTNAWQIVQQAIILRETRGDGGVGAKPAGGSGGSGGPGGSGGGGGTGGSGEGSTRRSPGATSGRPRGVEDSSNKPGSTSTGRPDRLPRRGGSRGKR